MPEIIAQTLTVVVLLFALLTLSQCYIYSASIHRPGDAVSMWSYFKAWVMTW